MSTSHFKLKTITDLRTIKEGDKLPESDFSLFTSEDKFVQFDFVDEEENTSIDKYIVKSGLYNIAVVGNKMVLRDAQYNDDRILEDYIVTKDISDKINTFFNRVSIYAQYGIFPKRGILLYGAPGCGKSQTIAKLSNNYKDQQDTLIVLWPSDKLEARHVKDFIKAFDYEKNDIKKLILIIEDLGGTEHTDRGMRPSESSLLSLLDNVDSTFKIPTMIIATTNFPENFLENLTNRPQRFDDVIEVKKPNGEFRAKFLEFFSQGAATTEDLVAIKEKKYDELSVAHVKEVVIRGALYGIALKDSLEQVLGQSIKAKKGFKNNTSKMGFGLE